MLEINIIIITSIVIILIQIDYCFDWKSNIPQLSLTAYTQTHIYAHI